ncbi:hypothetical protein [Nocardia mikamii]|uniref:hypothetical protein n=1 Tax=Nocardia mikamii TaxID=508464 RepID=UPI0007A40F64|nr:hypothetical protein [Nocardia mikamii]
MPRHTLDPDDTLAQFRATCATIADTITAYNRDEHRIERAVEAADHHDRLEELYRDATELMAALDDHLATGGPLPTAWTPVTPAPPHPAAEMPARRTDTETRTSTQESR